MDSRFSQSGFVTGSCLFVMEARKPPFFYSCFFCGGKFRLFVCRAMNPLFDAALCRSTLIHHMAVSTAKKRGLDGASPLDKEKHKALYYNKAIRT